MSLMDPYSPCFCGSGQKYKWCCQKVESFLVRAARLMETGQPDMAVKALDEGLAKTPDSQGLLLRKVAALIEQDQLELAREILTAFLSRYPLAAPARSLIVRLELELHGVTAAALEFQRAWAALAPATRPRLAQTAHHLGMAMMRSNKYVMARKYFEYAIQGDAELVKEAGRALTMFEREPKISIWQKSRLDLSPVPAQAGAEFRESFARALEWASEGLYLSAGSAFERLASSSRVGNWADRNAGLCWIWAGDLSAGIKSLRRYIARTPPSWDVLELEALCQEIEDPPIGEQVDIVRLSWPLRDRGVLLENLQKDKTCVELGRRPLDPQTEGSELVDCFLLVDREPPDAVPELQLDQIPLIEGMLLIAGDQLILEGLDDGRMDRLMDRVGKLAGRAIPPAHPRTRIIDHVQKHDLAMRHRYFTPRHLEYPEQVRIQREMTEHVIRTIWPRTPHPALDWLSPIEASRRPELRVPLRAAILRIQCSLPTSATSIDWDALRREIGIEPEPDPLAAPFDPAQDHLLKIVLAPADRLNDEQLAAVVRRGLDCALYTVIGSEGVRLANRADLIERFQISLFELYSALVLETISRGSFTEAQVWLERGRSLSGPGSRRDPFHWDLLELSARVQTQPPAQWVPYMAVLLDRVRNLEGEMGQRLLFELIQLGLVRLVPDYEGPGTVGLDMSKIEELFATYGPRVTTSTGRLAVSEERIWTPESRTPAAGGIWTPGQSAEPQTKPGLIITGQ